MKGLQENRLLAIFSTKNPLTGLLKLIANKPQMPPECNYIIMDGLHNLSKQALQNGLLRQEDIENLSTILKTISLLASYEEEPKGLTQLLDEGLTNMILDILVATLRCVKNCASSGVDQFMEDILEVIGAVSDYSTKAKSYVMETFCNTLMQIVMLEYIRFSTKMETLKTINLILEGCPLQAREKMKESPEHKELIQRLSSLIFSIGDYEFQVGIIEALFRLSNKVDRETFARGCFKSKECLEAFYEIRDSDFETDCRKFLNILNEKNVQKLRVISVPCRKACLGDYQLVKPADTKYLEFWVDFNIGSKRISLFCNPETPLSQDEEEGMWETVSIWHDNLLSYTCKDHGSKTEARIELRGRARDLIGFGPMFNDRTVSLQFDRGVDVKTALDLTFRKTNIQLQASRKISQSINSLNVAARKPLTENFQRRELTEKIATAVVTPAKRPHVSVPCNPMNRLHHQNQPSHEKPARPLSNEKSPKMPRTPTGTRGVKRVKTPLQLVSSAKSDDSAHSVVELSSGGRQSRTTSRKVSVGVQRTQADKSVEDQCQKHYVIDNKTGETEVVIPSSMADEPTTVIYDSQPPTKDLLSVLNDTEKNNEMLKLANKRSNYNSEIEVSLDMPELIPPQGSQKDNYEMETAEPGCDVYVKNTLRASVPPVLSTVNEESTTPCVSEKSPKLTAEWGSVEHDKARMLNEMLASKSRTVGRITMMSPDSTSQSTVSISYHQNDGVATKKRKRKRRKKACRMRAKKAAVAMRKPTNRVDNLVSPDGLSDAELECLSEETETVNLSDEDFKPESNAPFRGDPYDKNDVPTNQRLPKRKKEADSILQEQKDNSCKIYKEVEQDSNCRLDSSRMQLNKMVNKEESRTMTKSSKEKQKVHQEEKKPQKGRMKTQDNKAFSNDVENNGKASDNKKIEVKVCCINGQEIESHCENHLDKAADVETARSQESDCQFGSQINDFETESQDVNLIHRDDFEEHFESQESIACDEDAIKIEQSKLSKAVKVSFKGAKKELKTLQDTKSAKEFGNPLGIENHAKAANKQMEKMVDPHGLEDHSEFGKMQSKKRRDQHIDNPSKEKSKESMMERSYKIINLRKSGDDSFHVHETSVTKEKPPKFFKSRHKERIESRKLFDSSDDVYTFEPDTNAADISKKNKNILKTDRNGGNTASDDDLLSDSEEQSKLNKSVSENSFWNHKNKPRNKKPLPKNKNKKGSEHSDVIQANDCQSAVVDEETLLRKEDDKAKNKLKCLSTLRERFQTSAPYDFEDAVATNFGFDADGHEDIEESVTTYASDDHTKKGKSKCLGKDKHASMEGNVKQKLKENSKTSKNHSLQAKTEIKKTQKEKEANTYKPAVMIHGVDISAGNTNDVEEFTRGDIPDFGQLCRGLIEASEYNFRSVSRRPSRRVNYKDISDSEIDATPSVGMVLECASTKRKQSAHKKRADPYTFNVCTEVMAPARKRHKKSVFSETDEGADTRSEVSWLGSTARKGKPRPARTYSNRAGKLPLHTATPSDSEGFHSDQDVRVQVIHKKNVMRKRRKPDSPKLTEGEDSEAESLYYRPYQSAAHKENHPTALSKHRKATPQRKNLAACFKPSLRRFNTPNIMTPVMSKTPTSTNGSLRGARYQTLNVQINKTPVTPGSCLDVSIEEFRFENLELTPHVALDSPITLQRYGMDEVNLAESADENVEVLTHASCMRSGSSPTSYRSLGCNSTMSTNDNRGLDLAEALEDVKKSGPYKKTSGRQAVHKRQYAYIENDEGKEEGEEEETETMYGEEDERRELEPLAVSIRPRKLFQDSVTAGSHIVPGNDEMPEERLDEDEDGMDEEGTTSVSETGTSLPRDFDVGMSIAGLGKSFGAQLQRNLLVRKQSVEQLTKHALKVTQRQVTSFWSQQHMSRKQLLNEFRDRLLQEVYNLEEDCSRCTEAENKVLVCIKQEQKVIASCKQSQGKRLQNLHMIRDDFMRTLKKLDTSERGQLSTIRETMKIEMQALQRKLLQRSQQQEMNQVKRAMQTLFM